MKNHYLPLILLCCAFLAGCGKKKKNDTKKSSHKKEVFTEVDIPVTGDNLNTYVFNDFSDGFNNDLSSLVDTDVQNGNEYTWLDENNRDGFKTVYFNFDKSSIRKDQEETVRRNIELAKKKIAHDNEEITVVIDGHACSSAGSRLYNLALSEERAKVLRDRFIAAGVPADKIKIVARGMEVPAIVNGHAVTGDREAQWPNRRDEVHFVEA